MPNLKAFKETEGDKDSILINPQFKEVMKRGFSGAERKTCNEKHDIRDKIVSGNPFTSSAQKVLDADLRHSEKPNVGQDEELHADTTDIAVNIVTGVKKGGFTESAQNNLSRQKDKKVPDAIKRKVFQN